MKNEDILLELLKEVREDQKKDSDKLSKHGEELVYQSACLNNLEKDLKEVKVDLSKNTSDVAEHVRRSNLLEDLHRDNEKRLDSLEVEVKKKDERLKKLEAPEIAKAWFRENLKWILTTATLASGLVSKLMGLW